MPITSIDKSVELEEILCDGSTRASLSLTGEPEISEIPTDIMLVLDRSGSMYGHVKS